MSSFFGVIVGSAILAGWRDNRFFWRYGEIQDPPSGVPSRENLFSDIVVPDRATVRNVVS